MDSLVIVNFYYYNAVQNIQTKIQIQKGYSEDKESKKKNNRMQTNDDEMSGKMRTWIVIVSILLPILFSEFIEWLFK